MTPDLTAMTPEEAVEKIYLSGGGKPLALAIIKAQREAAYLEGIEYGGKMQGTWEQKCSILTSELQRAEAKLAAIISFIKRGFDQRGELTPLEISDLIIKSCEGVQAHNDRIRQEEREAIWKEILAVHADEADLKNRTIDWAQGFDAAKTKVLNCFKIYRKELEDDNAPLL